MKKQSVWWLIGLTPFIFLMTHAIAYLAHEYWHALSAWLLGYKANPFALHYGTFSWHNVLLLDQVSENVDYDRIEGAHPYAAAFIAWSGFGIGNVSLFILAARVLTKKASHGALYYYFFLWLAVMNLGNFIDYVPVRTFSPHGDMHEIVSALHVSPWWLMLILGYPISYSVWYFYKRLLPTAYQQLHANYWGQVTLLLLTTVTLFFLFGGSARDDSSQISRLFTLLSFYLIPIILIACWPKRRAQWQQRTEVWV